jgi:phosphate transport system permease protein
VTGIALPRARSKRQRDRISSWRLADRIGLLLCWALGALFCVIAGAIVLYMLVNGLHYLRPELLVTHPTGGYGEAHSGGFLDPLLGTFLVAILAMAIAIPIGVATAIWLSEFARPAWLARTTESTVEMLAGAPSIVLALFGTIIFQSGALGFFSRSSGGVVFGRSFFAAGAMLSLVAMPLVVANTREGLQLIPAHVREASYAVGKTKAATIRRILLPAARPQMATGAILGIGRVIGDTAIIVILLGATLTFNGAGGLAGLSTLRGTGSTLTSYIYTNSPAGEGNQPTKAYAAAFVLLLMVLALNASVDLVARRGKKYQWNS